MTLDRHSLWIGRGRRIAILCLILWTALAIWLDQLPFGNLLHGAGLHQAAEGPAGIGWMGLALAALALIAYFVFLLKISDSQNRRSIIEQFGQAR